MKRRRRYLQRIVTVSIISADIPDFLNTLENHSISIFDVQWIDPMRIQFSIKHRQLPVISSFAVKKGARIEKINQQGMIDFYTYGRDHPILLAGVILIIFLSIWLPGRVLFVRVEGNQTLPASYIKEYAEYCGIKFCSSRRDVRSEKMKNQLLEMIPELQWAGINTYGCTAVITVKEREDFNFPETNTSIGSVVALRDGIIRKIIVYKGNSLCRVGEAVKEGQVLVSGYTDYGICVVATQAKAEIFGETRRSLALIQPIQYVQRTQILGTKRKISLIIGKKRINFYKGSGISGCGCAKIYKENYITLPGGFILPISIVIETAVNYDISQSVYLFVEDCLTDYAATYLSKQMIGGVILASKEDFLETTLYCRLDVQYSCYELIGTIRIEESIKPYE